MSFAAKGKKNKSSKRIKDRQIPHTVLQKLSPKTMTSPLSKKKKKKKKNDNKNNKIELKKKKIEIEYVNE